MVTSAAVSSNPCGGACCRRFFVHTHSPEQILAKYEWAVARIVAGEDDSHSWDVVTIHEMLLPLEVNEDGHQAYTCRHFDEPAGLCTIYERRPLMCATYPSDQPCGHCGFSNPSTCAECTKEAA